MLAGLAGYLSSLPSGAHAGTWRSWCWVIALLLVLWFVVRPFLEWLVTTYTFTNRRLITRTGILTRRRPRRPAEPDQRHLLREGR